MCLVRGQVAPAQSLNAFRDVLFFAIREDFKEMGEDIRIFCIGRKEDLELDRPKHMKIALQRNGRIGDVVPRSSRGLPLVLDARFGSEEGAAQRGVGMVGVIGKRQRLLITQPGFWFQCSVSIPGAKVEGVGCCGLRGPGGTGLPGVVTRREVTNAFRALCRFESLEVLIKFGCALTAVDEVYL